MTKTIAHVVDEVIYPSQRPLLTRLLLEARQATKGDGGAATSLVSRHPCADQRRLLQLDVRLHFAADVALDVRLSNDCANPSNPALEPGD